MEQKFKVMLDTMGFNRKPRKEETGGIVNRLAENPVDLNVNQLIDVIQNGQSIVPAYLGKLYKGRISKTQNCWSHQQLMFLDFDNEKEVPDPLPDKPNNKKKVKDVQLTFHHAAEIFKDVALLMYKSFSYAEDHPKFRVVFALDRLIQNKELMDRVFNSMKQMYPYIDSKCLEVSRLFYGGYDVHVFNHNNVISVSTLLSQESDKRGLHNNLSIVYYVPPSSTPVLNNIILENNTMSIIKKDIVHLRTVVKSSPVSMSKQDLYEFLYKVDFSKLLGVNNKDICLFHDDNDPSAVINSKDTNGHYVYHCYGCGFSGNIITCVEKLFADSNIPIKRGAVVDLLRQIYQIDIELDEWGKEQKRELEANVSLLISNEIEEFEPNLHKAISKGTASLIALHHIAMDNIKRQDQTDSDGNIVFYKDLRSLTSIMGKSSTDKVSKDINFFTYLGILNKVDIENVPKNLKLDAAKFQHNNKYKYKRNFYSIPSYTVGVRKFADEKSSEWKQKGYVKKEFTREALLRGHGEEEANRVFPQMKGTQISKDNDKVAQELMRVGLILIEEKRWTTEKEIEDNIHLYCKDRKWYKSYMMKTIRSEFWDSYGLIKQSLNKKLAEKYNIEIPVNEQGNKMYPKIIHRK
ncbi:CHC2 zinc finger domain-containing protein [Paenibacillus taichungensis]